MKKLLKVAIFAILIVLFIYFGTRDYKIEKKKKIDEKNASSILLDDGYLFTEINHSKVLNKISSKNDAIIYFCIDGNELCTKYGLLIDEVFKTFDVNEIYYYDIKEDRENNNGTYQKILTYLTDYLITDDVGEQDLHAPSLLFIKNGNIYAFDDELSIIHGAIDIDKIWNEEVINAKREYLTEVIGGYLGNE